MRRLFPAVLLVHATTLTAMEMDDWLIDDYRPHAMSLYYGTDDNNGSLSGITLTTPFINNSSFDVYYTGVNSPLETGGSSRLDQYGLTWLSDTERPFSAGLGYSFTDRQDVFEIEDWKLLAQYTENSWYLGLSVIQGELKAYTLPDDTVNRPIWQLIRQRLGSVVSIDRNGIGLTTGLQKQNWSLRAGLTAYDYSRDLSRIRERLTQIYFKRGVVDEIFQLTNWEFYADTLYLFDGYSLSFGFNTYELHVEEEIYNQVSAGIEVPLSDAVSVGALINYTIDDSASYGQLSLNLYW